MTATWKRILIVLGVGAVVLALAGTAIAVGPQHMSQRFGAQHAAHGYGMMGGGAVMDAAAEYIGVGDAQLASARHDGQSLAQIATGNGKSVTGLQQALASAVKTNLDKAVSAGTLTQAQATQALATFQSQVDTLVNRTATGPMFGHGGGAGLGLCGGMR